MPGKDSSPSNIDQRMQALALSIPSKGRYRQTPHAKASSDSISIPDNNLMPEHKKLGNQTAPIMVYTL